MNSDRPLLVHHHITKSGGTSFNKSVLPSWFDDDQILVISRTATSNPDGRQRWRAAGPDDWNKYEAAAGHDFVGIGDLSGRRLIKFAFFRDPINRAVSKWYHHLNKKKPSPAMSRLIERHNGDVFSYLKETDLAFDYLRAFLPLELHIAYQKSISKCSGSQDFVTRYPELWRTMLDRAVTNLSALDFMLVTEQFDASVRLIAQQIGKPVPDITHHRVGKIPPEIKQQVATLRPDLEAAQMNAYALMKTVHARFERQLKAAGIEAIDAA